MILIRLQRRGVIHFRYSFISSPSDKAPLLFEQPFSDKLVMYCRKTVSSVRRGAGVADRAGLENRCGSNPTEGSNPSLSACFEFRPFAENVDRLFRLLRRDLRLDHRVQ